MTRSHPASVQGWSPKGWSPKGWSPKGWSTKGWTTKGWSANVVLRGGPAPRRADPPGSSKASPTARFDARLGSCARVERSRPSSRRRSRPCSRGPVARGRRPPPRRPRPAPRSVGRSPRSARRAPSRARTAGRSSADLHVHTAPLVRRLHPRRARGPGRRLRLRARAGDLAPTPRRVGRWHGHGAARPPARLRGGDRSRRVPRRGHALLHRPARPATAAPTASSNRKGGFLLDGALRHQALARRPHPHRRRVRRRRGGLPHGRARRRGARSRLPPRAPTIARAPAPSRRSWATSGRARPTCRTCTAT
jgi:hypothetical protein